MINYDKQQLELDGKELPIKNFQVWWLGPTGLVLDLTTALRTHELLQLSDTPFYMAWKAIPVAVAENGLYEELR